MGLCASRDLNKFKSKYKQRYLVPFLPHTSQIERPVVSPPRVQEKPSYHNSVEMVKLRKEKPRYLRSAACVIPDAPKLGELEESPWKFNPRESYSQTVKGSASCRHAADLRESCVREPDIGASLASQQRKRLINVIQSEELGELNKFTIDQDLFHPDLYEEEPRPANGQSQVNARIEQMLRTEDADKVSNAAEQPAADAGVPAGNCEVGSEGEGKMFQIIARMKAHAKL